MKPLTFSPTDLPLLRQQLDAWRHRQTGRGRLPPELWAAAGQVATTHGVSAVARALRIDFYRVRHHTPAVSKAPPVRPTAPQFVELPLDPPPPTGAAQGWVELRAGPHRQMHIATGHDPAAWVALAEAFWRATP